MLEHDVVDMKRCIADEAAVANAVVSFPAAADTASPDVDATLRADKCQHDSKPIAFKSCLQDSVLSLASSRSCQPV